MKGRASVAAKELTEEFCNNPFWRGSSVARNVAALANFVAEAEWREYARRNLYLDIEKPRLRVKMGRAVV